VSSHPEGREWIRRTTIVDGIEPNGSDPDENLVLAYLGDRCFLQNDGFSLKVWW
jgi:hypothetical protein